MAYTAKEAARFDAEELALLTGKAIPPTGGIDDETLGTAIADVEDLINTALQQRYTLPLHSPPLGRDCSQRGSIGLFR